MSEKTLYRKNPCAKEYRYQYDSPLGGMTLASNGDSLTGLWFDHQKYFPNRLESECKNLPIFDQTCEWLDIYFSGKNPNFTPPLYVDTTEFRKTVCKIMLTIPYGHTVTYGDIAKILAKQKGLPRMSAQAVGGAVAHNRISIIIPCHRVVGVGGNLTGYGGGIEKKIKLLALEKIDMSQFFVAEQNIRVSATLYS